MEIKILQENLQSAINYIEKIASKDTTLPILNNILLKAEEKKINIMATNLETGIVWRLAGKIEQEGSVVLPAQIFSSLINSFSGGMVVIKTNNNSILITNNFQKSNLNNLPTEEFPIIPVDFNGDYLNIRADLFCQALSCVVNFTGTSSIKPEITGVYLVFSKNNIKIVATDSFRLGEKTISILKQTTLSDNFSVIIPVRAAREIISIFNDKQKNINIYINNNQITINLSNEDDLTQPQIQFVSRLIEGDFPDYQAIIPTSYTAGAVFLKKDILNSLKSASIFAGKNNEINFKLSNKNSTITISSQSADFGGYESELKLDSVSGDDVSIVFNGRFLMEGLNSIKTDKCVIEFSGSDGPGVLKSAENQDFVYILMPIKKY